MVFFEFLFTEKSDNDNTNFAYDWNLDNIPLNLHHDIVVFL